MTPQHRNFDLDYDSQGLTKSAKRELTAQERQWISDLVQSNKLWADVTIGDISVDGECTCGCRAVHLERPSQPHNGRTAHVLLENVGMMWIITETGKIIGIGLNAKHGSLGELEVVYQENTEPWPATWSESSRKFLSGL